MSRLKQCKECGVRKEETHFQKNHTYKDGLTSKCRQCISVQRRAHYLNHKESIKTKALEYYKENRERRITQMREYTANNQDKERIRRKRYREANLLQVRASEAQKIQKRRRATPPWADLKAIKEFYQNRPEGCHVDHIIPLQGKDICGLHVLENLQYLPAKDNLRKGNQWHG